MVEQVEKDREKAGDPLPVYSYVIRGKCSIVIVNWADQGDVYLVLTVASYAYVCRTHTQADPGKTTQDRHLKMAKFSENFWVSIRFRCKPAHVCVCEESGLHNLPLTFPLPRTIAYCLLIVHLERERGACLCVYYCTETSIHSRKHFNIIEPVSIVACTRGTHTLPLCLWSLGLTFLNVFQNILELSFAHVLKSCVS